MIVGNGAAAFAFDLLGGVSYPLNRAINLVGEFLIGFYGSGALFGIRGGISFNV